MAHIVIEDLTADQENLILGAGLRSFRPSFGGLPGRRSSPTLVVALILVAAAIAGAPYVRQHLPVRLHPSATEAVPVGPGVQPPKGSPGAARRSALPEQLSDTALVAIESQA